MLLLKRVAFLIFLLGLSALVFCGDVHEDVTCPTWMYHNISGSSQCVCGVDLHKAVLCNASLEQVQVRECYMITYDVEFNETVAGHSFYTCARSAISLYFKRYYPVPSNASQVNQEICDPLNRSGLFCGACKEGYSPLVCSYNTSCINCSGDGVVRTSLIFVAFVIIPVTLFYFFVLLFQFNANSPSLHGFVLLAQLLSQTYSTRTLFVDVRFSDKLKSNAVLLLQTLYSIWSLNFFREFIPDICFKISTLSALSLEYVVAFYPMMLIMITCVAVELHSRGFRLILLIWRPFQHCSMYFRKEWNIKLSLINVFATFLLLSYNRLLDISFSLLLYTNAYNPRGEAVGRYLYYDSSKEYFGEEHRPFGIVAIFVLITFNVVPFLLLLLYPMKWFQNCLNLFKLNHFALYTFMDLFIGCYKDGTEPKTRDCRYFAACFFLLRFVNYVVLACTYDIYALIVLLIVFTCFGAIFTSAQPYKSKFSHHNITITLFLMIIIIFCCCCFGYMYSLMAHQESSRSLILFIFLLLTLPHGYVACLLLKWTYDRVPWKRLPFQFARLRTGVSTESLIEDSARHVIDGNV